MKKISLDEKLTMEIINDYKSGTITTMEISKKYKISSRVFYRVLEENGIEIKKRPRTKRKPPKHNLVGQRFFHLVVEEMKLTEKSKDRSYRCICKCDCGRIADCNTNYLMRGLSKTCGNKECIYHRQDYTNNGKNNVNFTGHEEILGSKWSSYRCGAKRRNLEFTISIIDAWNLFLKQERKCFYTGMGLSFGKTNTDFENSTASLDRIDSKKGYTIDNVVWVHKKINIMKMDLDENEFIFFCNKVSERNKNKNYEHKK